MSEFLKRSQEALSLTAAIEAAGRKGNKTYETENGPVEVVWKKFDPNFGAEGSEARKREPLAGATIFLPGSYLTADSKSIETLNQSFADYAAAPAYAISTRTERPPESDMFREEAEAIRRFIEEKGLSEVVVSGHSRGGDESIDLTALLREKNPGINVRGLVLLDSVGLYDQSEAEFARGNMRDSLNSLSAAGKSIGSKTAFLKRGLRTATDMLFNNLREFGRSKTGYPARARNELQEMAKMNKNIENIDVPVILVHGEEDPISSPKKVAPVNAPSEREAYLQENLFKKSPYVRMVVAAAEKAGQHGLPLFHSESVARGSLYMLERYWREKNKAE